MQVYRVTITAHSTGKLISTYTFAARKDREVLGELEKADAPPKTLDWVRRNGTPRRINWESPHRKVVITADKKGR